MGKRIYEAVANLPEELITPEIAAAAIEEGNIQLLDCLPHKYLTGEVVVSVIEKNSSSYSYYGFKLSSLPEDIRTKEVCEFAVQKDASNILSVPDALRSASMLEKMLGRTKQNLKYLHLFAPEVWSVELAIAGVKDIYSETRTNYGPRGGYHGTSTKTDIKPVQIFLSYVPNGIKAREFYTNLATTNLNQEDVVFITPQKYKAKAYYLNVAAKEFKLVPKQFYDYDIFMAAIEKRKISFREPSSYSYYGKPTTDQIAEKEWHQQLMKAIADVMDEAMADKIIEVMPDVFLKLPAQFQTSSRLISSIEKGDRNVVVIDSSTHSRLLTKAVCKAYIKKNSDIPKLPNSIWTSDFVEYCMQYGTCFKWFEQLPKELQTREMVHEALMYCTSNIKHIRIELISLEQAFKIYREEKYYREHIPAMLIKDFENETGLNSDFVGGELSYAKFREKREMNTYCKIGNSYLSISKGGYNSPVVITMTRRTPQSFRPIVIFSKSIDTFHATWLEKMIADYDSSFVKPTVSKTLKPYQVNGYFALKKVGAEYGTDIYANSLLGEQISFAALIDGEVVRNESLDKLKEELKEFHTESIDFGTLVLPVELQAAI